MRAVLLKLLLVDAILDGQADVAEPSHAVRPSRPEYDGMAVRGFAFAIQVFAVVFVVFPVPINTGSCGCIGFVTPDWKVQEHRWDAGPLAENLGAVVALQHADAETHGTLTK